MGFALEETETRKGNRGKGKDAIDTLASCGWLLSVFLLIYIVLLIWHMRMFYIVRRSTAIFWFYSFLRGYFSVQEWVVNVPITKKQDKLVLGGH